MNLLYTKMKYGQISGSRSINATIYECFQHIEEVDAQRFVSEFRSQPHDKQQVLHTFRELILGGSYLATKWVPGPSLSKVRRKGARLGNP